MQVIFLTTFLKENMHKTKRIRYRSNLKRMPIYRARSGARTRSRTRQYFPFPPVSTKTIINLKGNFSCFLYSSSPKWRPIIAFQCLQTNTPQIAGFLTCSLFTFFNTRRKYWTLIREGSLTISNNYSFYLFLNILLVYYFFGWQKIRKVLTGVLARVLTRSPGSIPGLIPGFDVSQLSPI